MPPPNLQQLLDQSRFPGRFEKEHEVIGDWLAARGHLYDRIEFNVPIGSGVILPDTLVEPYRSNAERSAAKRADVVAWMDGGVILIEAKGRAMSDAVGQLLVYRPAWEVTFPDTPVLGLEIICRRINDDDLRGALAAGITVREYALEDGAQP